MSHIASSLSASGSLVSLLKGNTSAVTGKMDRSGFKGSGAQNALSDPATILDLSQQAQDLLSQLGSDQDVADKLQELLTTLKGETEKSSQ